MNDIYAVLYPVHFLFTLLGLTNLTVQKTCINKNTKNINLQRAALYLFILFCIGVNNPIVYPKDLKLYSVVSFVRSLKVYAINGFLLLVAVCTEKYDLKLVNICDKLTCTDMRIKELGAEINDKNLRKYSICLIVLILSFIVSIGIKTFSLPEFQAQLITTLMLFVFDTYKSTIEIGFHIYVLLLKKRFTILNERLLNIEEGVLNYRIDELRNIHLHLVEITNYFNHAFSLPVLSCFVSNLIMIVARTHTLCYILIFLRYYTTDYIILTILWMLCYVFDILLIILTASSLSAQVS